MIFEANSPLAKFERIIYEMLLYLYTVSYLYIKCWNIYTQIFIYTFGFLFDWDFLNRNIDF